MAKKRISAGRELKINAGKTVSGYYEALNKKTWEYFDLANSARKKGFDASEEVESLPVFDVASRTESLVGPKGIAERYRKVFEENNGNRTKAIFQIFEEIIQQKWCEIPDKEKRLEQAIKTALMIETEGVVISPLDGLPMIKISKNFDNTEYIDIYYAGPIRAAGGKATVLPLLLADYARKQLDLDSYKPTEEEVKRYVEEIMIYQNELVSRQYLLTEEEIETIINGCPICINGLPSETKEVSMHRDLERIPTNRIRGSIGLVVSEGIALKAPWVLETAKKFGLDWSWLEKIIKVKKTAEKVTEIKPSWKYLDRMAAGRPLLAYPMRQGGFRIRYGRARNTGLMAKGINPATMILLNEFIAVGTHIRIERPGKAAQLFPVDCIDGPIVLLQNGEVLQVNDLETAKQAKPFLKEIIYLGDILVSYGDFRKTAEPLLPAGYCEEYWKAELEKIIEEKKIENQIAKKAMNNPKSIDCFEAIELSLSQNIPLHPKFLHYYSCLTKQELEKLVTEFKKAEKVFENSQITAAILEFEKETKKLLEKIGLPHKLEKEKIIIEKEQAYPTLKTFGALNPASQAESITENILESLSKISGMTIKDKSGSFVGARMGRPEAARERTMKGNPHALFPIGLYGGSTRSINKAMNYSDKNTAKLGIIEAETATYYCEKCEQATPFQKCLECNEKTLRIKICPNCSNMYEIDKEKCNSCRTKLFEAQKQQVNVHDKVRTSLKELKEQLPEIIKGVKGLFNSAKIPEPIEKGILRAKHNIHVFRDGTSRFELLNATLTHFKPKEIGITIEKAKQLGYTKDQDGNELKNEEQIIELFPQDIIVNEKCGEWLIKTSKFIDDLMEKYYGMKRIYNSKTKEDMIGELIIGLAPHTSAGIIGRIIGYSKARVGWQHPYFIACKRRNCLEKNTPILIELNGKTRIIPIGELDSSKKMEIRLKKAFAFAPNEKGNIVKEKITALHKEKSPEKLLKIKTVFGREILVTKDHKMLAWNGKKVEKIQAGKLREGNKLISLKKISLSKKVKEINLLEWLIENSESKEKLRVHNVKIKLKKAIEKNCGWSKAAKKINWKGKKLFNAVYFDSIPLNKFEELIKSLGLNLHDFKETKIGYNKQKSQIPALIPANRELGELTGYLLADGWFRTTNNKKRKKFVYQTGFASAEKEITEKMVQNISKLFKTNPIKEKRSKLDYVTLSGRIFYEFFTTILGTNQGAKNKRIPPILFNSGNECIAGLLGGFISGDGSIDENSIKIDSINKKLINDLVLACSLKGIFPHLSKQERIISTGAVKEFYEKKNQSIKIKSYRIKIYSNDTKKIGAFLIGKKKKKFFEIMKSHEFRKKRSEMLPNFFADKIKEITEINAENEFVYDLIVEGNKSFIAGHGLLGVFDCDGDQDSIMLLMDCLLNFSEKYLSDRMGGRMDAPLVFTIALDPKEIDSEAHEIETVKSYPLEFYEKTLEYSMPNKITSIETVANKLGKQNQYENIYCTTPTECFDSGPKQSTYTALLTMEDKIKAQSELQEKIRAVDLKDSLERVIMGHFFPDIIGNTRAFSRQTFRCTNCNTRYRRIPLSGKCSKCKAGHIILTIAEGSVKKYLKIARGLIEKYELSNYLKQRLELIEKEITTIFEASQTEQTNEKLKQKTLLEFLA